MTMPTITLINLPVNGAGAITDAPRRLLVEYAAQIDALDQALADESAQRSIIEIATQSMAYEETRHTLLVEGKNEAERKAHLHLALEQDDIYLRRREEAASAKVLLRYAERRAQVAREACRFYRAALALYAGMDTDQ